MISTILAKALKNAGLPWQAKINDFFAIPEHGLDDRIFVISELQSNLDTFRGWPVVTFHGSAEWALDYILTTEVVWLPTEEQIREILVERLANSESPGINFVYNEGNYRCSLYWQGELLHFDDPSGIDAYGKALLHLLEAK